MPDPLIVRTPDELERLGYPYLDTDIAVTLDLLVNGRLTMEASDVFVLGGKRYRPVRWDLSLQALICWEVA